MLHIVARNSCTWVQSCYLILSLKHFLIVKASDGLLQNWENELGPYSITFCLGQNAGSCLVLHWEYLALLQPRFWVPAHKLSRVYSIAASQTIWESRYMLILWFSLVLSPALKNCTPWISVYLFITIASQKNQPFSPWADCPESWELLNKVKILQSHIAFVVSADAAWFAVTYWS